uniref:Uncharacterized protein n=1 Tax=Arundo donax TaxID=35708 RepID=A0A0A9E3T1_ARUDO
MELRVLFDSSKNQLILPPMKQKEQKWSSLFPISHKGLSQFYIYIYIMR